MYVFVLTICARHREPSVSLVVFVLGALSLLPRLWQGTGGNAAAKPVGGGSLRHFVAGDPYSVAPRGRRGRCARGGASPYLAISDRGDRATGPHGLSRGPPDRDTDLF